MSSRQLKDPYARLRLIRSIYNQIFNGTNSFYDDPKSPSCWPTSRIWWVTGHDTGKNSKGGDCKPCENRKYQNLLNKQRGGLKLCRERAECWAKLERLGLVKLKEGESPVT